MEDPQDSLGDETAPRTINWFGLGADTVGVGEQAVDFGFGIANQATTFGFGVANFFIRGTADVVEGTAGRNPVSTILHWTESIVGGAQDITLASQEMSLAVTQAALSGVHHSLALAGAPHGELLKLIFGAEIGLALLRVDHLVRNFLQPLAEIPMQDVHDALLRWSAIQHAWLRQLPLFAAQDPAITRKLLPLGSEKAIRYAASSLGSSWKAGLVNGVSFAAARDAYRRARDAAEHGVGAMALAAAGIEADAEVVLYEDQNASLFSPGHMVVADYEENAIFVCIRGTASASDVLVDLVCHATPYRMESQNLEGYAHEGMLTAARRLSPVLAAAVQDGLEKLQDRKIERDAASSHPDDKTRVHPEEAESLPRVILCGHSLGAGVASLLASEWREKGIGTEIGGRISLTCFAFACPQVLSKDLAVSMEGFCYSVVLGDDAVPRLSLATACDLREAVVMLSREDQRQTTDHDVVATVARSLLQEEIHRLYPPGQLYYLRATSGGSDDHAYLIQTNDIEELIISSDMLASHMPHRYLAAVRSVDESGDAGAVLVNLV